MASPPMTLAQVRQRTLQELGIGGLDPSGAESTLNRPIPLPQFNYAVNRALQQVVEDVTMASSFKGVTPFNVTWPANTGEMTLGQLGVTNSRIDSVYLLDDQGAIVQRIKPAASDEITIAEGSGWRSGVAPLVNAGYMGFYQYTWSFAPPDKIRIAPWVGAPVNMQIRTYSSDGFIDLQADEETVPVMWFFHRCIEELLIYMVCAKVDPQLPRRQYWDNQIDKVKRDNTHVFTPQRPVEIVFGGI